MSSKLIDPAHVPQQTLGIIMGGGAGTRLYPLTKDRAKPAVPLAGKFRLVDIPISNCINSGIRRNFVLTQFNSTSLHSHINGTYNFDQFSDAFVAILAAQQTPTTNHWYQGTADAVRQNLRYFLEGDYRYFLILSGDQLYRMDYRHILNDHITSQADITIATIPVDREKAKSFGIMETADDGCITRFEEKPKADALLDNLSMSQSRLEEEGLPGDSENYLASMGIYVFNRDTLVQCLDNPMADFGKDIIPMAIDKYKVQSHVFQGYWEDIGTIRSFFEANLELTDMIPSCDFFDPDAPIYTRARFLPASKINEANIKHSIISDGCIITKSTIERSVIGVRSFIDSGTTLKDCIVMGNDRFDGCRETDDDLPHCGIGRDCRIETAIIDKNARIGDRVHISPEGKPADMDAEFFLIRDGIVVIPKNTVIPADTWI